MAEVLDPRTPVLVGAGQVSQRVDRGAEALEPVDLMVEALRRAEVDAGVSGLLARADSVRISRLLSWHYLDPGALVAERLGASVRQTVYTVMGGNYVQTLVNLTATDIARGRADVVLLAGAESWRTRTAARAAGTQLDWTTQPEGTEPTVMLGGDDTPLSSPREVERRVVLPVQVYPMFEVALRAAAGRTPDEQRLHAARLWSRFSEVAATNPHAWIQQVFTPEEIAEPTPTNRMIGYPYTKLMNSNNHVEQGAGLVLCSVAAAEAAGVPRDRWVFPQSGTDAHDHWFVSNRADLHSSPAMRMAGARALELAGVGADELTFVDLYSCFPSAVQIGAAELGLDIERPLTVTGGMSFAGGPWNNYPMHAIATTADRVREQPGAFGLVSGNGGYTTKHSFGVYATTPPPHGYRHDALQSAVDATPRRDAADDYDGPTVVEAYTVMHDRDGEPETGLFAL
ncbi:MAG TPA: acetyl-CoA acetyltransferase, partial [Acidimicrobiales bacterium]|nr:acetyl-CoA acetyltransferase [Acidimicrobiales bacterium]